jgi:hypothetical protein
MTESNVLSFPKNRIIRDTDHNIEELAKLKNNSIRNFADALTEEIAETVIQIFSANGVEIENEKFAKDFHFLVGVTNATIYRTLNIEHQFHSFLDEHVSFNEIPETELDKPE